MSEGRAGGKGPVLGTKLTGARRTITEADVVGFSSLTGDWHPQHADQPWAESSAFGERIAHGMLVLSYSVGLIGFDPERVIALRGLDTVRFKRPVRIGDTISVEAVIRDVKPIDDETSLVELAWTVSTVESGTAIKAKVQVLWRNEGSERAPGGGASSVSSAAAGGAAPAAAGQGEGVSLASLPIQSYYPDGLLL